MGLIVSDKSAFPTSLGRGRFHGPICSYLKNISGYRRFYLTSYVWRYTVMASLYS